jgi:histidinol-phosphate/aromatic aminotransferase/cobyric acid decarboxylase-like protein
MISEIKKTGLFILPSKTNFLFIKIKNRSILKELKKEKLMFKIFDLGKKGEFVRISIGKKRDNNKILEITRRYQNEGSYF